MHTPLTYIDISHIADHLGCRDDIIWFHQIGHHHPDNPCPEADAYLKDTNGAAVPLWLAARTQEWEVWNNRRKLLARQGPRNPGPISHPPENTEPKEHP